MRGVYGGVRDEVIHAAFIVAWKQNKPPKELRVFLFPYRRQQKKKNPWRRSIAMGRKCAREPRRKCWKEEQVEPACLFIYYIYIFLFLSSFFLLVWSVIDASLSALLRRKFFFGRRIPKALRARLISLDISSWLRIWNVALCLYTFI